MLKVCRTIEKTISSPCLAHLLNLVIEELFQPYACNKDKNKLTAQERSYVEYRLSFTKSQQEANGFIEKCRNLVALVNRSETLSKMLEKFQISCN
jgi:hypothetical protein